MVARRWSSNCNTSRQVIFESFTDINKGIENESGLSVVWHKWSDLRLLDHEPLVHAHAKKGPVLHVHLVEAALLSGVSRVGKVPRCSGRRAAFWREAVSDLSQRLENHGQLLLVRNVDKPADFFKSLCERTSVAAVFSHAEFCDEELKTEAAVRECLRAHGVPLQTFWGGLTVHHIDDLGFDARDPKQMPQFKGEFNKAAKRRPVRQFLPVPKKLVPPPELAASGFLASDFGPEAVAAAFANGPEVPPRDDRQSTNWVGGETAALEYLKEYMESGKLKQYCGATESFAHGDFNPVHGGTRLSPWLAFGCITARMVVQEARNYERTHGKISSGKGVGKVGSTGSRLHTELIFRDFLRFSALSWGTSLFKVDGPFQVSGLKWSYDQELFTKWKNGETGFPFVDAGMRELATTGYISHLHRQCCAAFLVRDLRLDWRMGAEHFESCLLDHTPDANWGNWSYRILPRPCLAQSRAKYPVEEHITTLEVVLWPVVHDPYLEHTLRWVPELRSLPQDLAREPWRTEEAPNRRIDINPYKDSPLWFCAANRTNWDYEYYWVPGHAWTVRQARIKTRGVRSVCNDFQLGRDYPRPIVPAVNVEIDLDALPFKNHGWGDTDANDRPHVWGTPGRQEKDKENKQCKNSEKWTVEPRKGKGKGGKSGKGSWHKWHRTA